MKVLVIGGTMFIGRGLVAALLKDEHEVSILHRRPGHDLGKRVHEIIADRNDPDALKSALSGKQFDLVFDGGTLEHVFNFSTALKNCMHMVKPHGRFVSVTLPNNWCGHGFYQFSPELFFRALTLSQVGRAMIRCVQSGAPKQVLEIADIAALAES